MRLYRLTPIAFLLFPPYVYRLTPVPSLYISADTYLLYRLCVCVCVCVCAYTTHQLAPTCCTDTLFLFKKKQKKHIG